MLTSGSFHQEWRSRLQTPCVIKLEESFALIVKSSQGISIASPIEGLINISSDNFKKIFEDEIQYLAFRKN